MKHSLFIQFFLVITLIGAGDATSSEVFASTNNQNTPDPAESLNIVLEIPDNELHVSGGATPFFYADEEAAFKFEHSENTLLLSAAYTLTGELPGIIITVSSGSLNIHDVNHDSDGSCKELSANKIECGAFTILKLTWLADSIGSSNGEQVFLSLASLASLIERDINMSIELPCSHRLNNASPPPTFAPEDGIVKWHGSGQVFSVQLELGTLIKLQVPPEEIEQVVDGICLRTIKQQVTDPIYIGVVDLLNPNVDVQLAHDFADKPAGEFWQKPVPQLVKENSGAGNSGLVGKYYLAINGTGFARDASASGGKTTASEDSVLGINNILYGSGGEDQFSEKSNNTSYFALTKEQAFIKRAGVDFNRDNAESIIRNSITTSEFVVGYRRTILDGVYIEGDGILDQHYLRPKTAIGVNRQGDVMYIATTSYAEGEEGLAEKIRQTGAIRATMFDGGASSQFSGHLENGNSIDFWKWGWDNKTTPTKVINAVVAYNREKPASKDSGAIQSEARGAGTDAIQEDYQITPKIKVSFPENAFSNKVRLVYNPHFPYYVDGLLGISFFEIKAYYVEGGIPANPVLPYQLTVNYSGNHIPWGMDEETFALYQLHGDRWERDPTSTLNTVDKVVSVTTTFVGTWGIFGGTPPLPTQIPDTGTMTPTPPATGTPNPAPSATPGADEHNLYLPDIRR
jgi:hypothetical protein